MSDTQKLRFTKGIINLIFSSIIFIALVCLIWLMFTFDYFLVIPAICVLALFYLFTLFSIEYLVASGSKKNKPQLIVFYSNKGQLNFLYGKICLVISYVLLAAIVSCFWLIFIMDNELFLILIIIFVLAFIYLICSSISFFYDAGEFLKEISIDTL